MNKRALLPLLLKCPFCDEDGLIEDTGQIAICNACEDGYQSVALPLREVLIIMGQPEEQQQAALRELATNHPNPKHPFLYSIADTPAKFRIPLRMSKGDQHILGKQTE